MMLHVARITRMPYACHTHATNPRRATPPTPLPSPPRQADGGLKLTLQLQQRGLLRVVASQPAPAQPARERSAATSRKGGLTKMPSAVAPSAASCAQDSVVAAWACKRSMPRLPATPLMEWAWVFSFVSQLSSRAVARSTALAA